MSAPADLLQVKHLSKHFSLKGGLFIKRQAVQAVDDVSFTIRRGETLGLVGESGCGKTTVARTILQLTPPTSGSIRFEGQEITGLRGKSLKALRKEMQIVFQDPFASLDPRMTVGESIAEGLVVHAMGTESQQGETVRRMLRMVGLEDYHASRHPHEFSAGQRQRIGIARALALRPKFLICDEPVSSLDVSIQSQILLLLKELQQRFELTYLFIAHNLNVIEIISDRVAVMYLGKIVELAATEDLFDHALHPYTQSLLSAIPASHPRKRKERILLSGDVPSPIDPPGGCRFHPRCPVAIDLCKRDEPPLKPAAAEHWAACWLIG